MINQKINQELLSKSTTTLAASRSAFQTAVVLKIQRLQFRSQSFVSLTKYFVLWRKSEFYRQRILKKWERECYGIALSIANMDIKNLEKNIYGILSKCILVSL